MFADKHSNTRKTLDNVDCIKAPIEENDPYTGCGFTDGDVLGTYDAKTGGTNAAIRI